MVADDKSLANFCNLLHLSVCDVGGANIYEKPPSYAVEVCYIAIQYSTSDTLNVHVL